MYIATWNVNSVRAREPRIVPWLEERSPEVVCLQELKCIDEQFPRQVYEDLGYHVETYGQKAYNGVAILSRETPTQVKKGMPGDPEEGERRVIAAEIAGIQIVNVYVVNGQSVGSEKYDFKLDWLERLHSYLSESFDMSRPFVITGDFNITFDDRDIYDPEAWRDKILCSKPEREALKKITDLGLIDAFRTFHEEPGLYTWWDFRTRGFQRKQGLRIDHFLTSQSLLDRCTDVEVDLKARDGEKPSDHAPVLLKVEST